MKVRLKAQLSGTRDGVAWPPIGTVVEIPDDEARDMIESGIAKATDNTDDHERAVVMPSNIEEAVERFIPETARHEPAVGVENLSDEDRRPNLDAIGLTDDGEIAGGPTNDEPSDEPVDMPAEATGTPVRSKQPTRPKPLTTKNGPTK